MRGESYHFKIYNSVLKKKEKKRNRNDFDWTQEVLFQRFLAFFIPPVKSSIWENLRPSVITDAVSYFLAVCCWFLLSPIQGIDS